MGTMTGRKGGEQLAKDMENLVNSFSDEEIKNFTDYMANNAHRTLQQNFMRLIVMMITKWAEMENAGRYDLRNEDTVKLAKKIYTTFKDEMYLRHV